ncbi:hypothetical protein AB1Y20_019707 [Prymnesium parvum]|uniref:Response regulatory domain-containing protein n=1 Tax=Prymnesium parvum TaxID=97485 RepID=A0AB34JUT5_PRYPA
MKLTLEGLEPDDHKWLALLHLANAAYFGTAALASGELMLWSNLLPASVSLYSLLLAVHSFLTLRRDELQKVELPPHQLLLYEAAHTWPVMALCAASLYTSSTATLASGVSSGKYSCSPSSNEAGEDAWVFDHLFFFGHTLVAFPNICVLLGISFSVLVVPTLLCSVVAILSITANRSSALMVHGLLPLLLPSILWAASTARSNRRRTEQILLEASDREEAHCLIRKKLEEQLAQASRRTEQKEVELSLAVLSLATQRLIDSTPSSQVAACRLESSFAAIDICLRLIKKQVKGARIQSSLDPMQILSVHSFMTDLVAPMLTELVNTHGEGPVTGECVVDADLVVQVRVHQQCLLEMMLSYISNAVQFTRRGHVRASASLDVTDQRESGADLVFSVEDTGLGIPSAAAEKLFDESPLNEGSLANVGRKARLFGGRVGHFCNRHGGTTFWFSIPCIPEQSTRIPASTSSETNSKREEAQEAATSSPNRILVVDDSVMITAMTESLLLSAGAEEVATAPNGIEAWSIFSSRTSGNTFTAVLTDDRMGAPHEGGVPFARRVRAAQEAGEAPPTFLVMCTSLSREKVRETYGDDVDRLFDAFYEKPINLTTIKSFLSEAGRRSAQ